MEVHLVRPHPALSAWVAMGVHLSFDTPGTHLVPCHFPALVEGGLTVVLEGRFFVKDPSGALVPLPAGFVSCARAVPLTLYRTPRLCLAGLRLQPTATVALLQSSPLSLPHQLANASDVFGDSWARLVACMKEESIPERRLASLLAFAHDRLAEDVHRQRAHRAALLQRVALRGAAPQDAVGLSVRQFERVFAGTFGVTPKLFQRVARVEGLLRDALATGTTDAGLALRHGYYDQSHMARDLRTLAGASLSKLIETTRQRDTENWALAVGTWRDGSCPSHHVAFFLSSAVQRS
ncbi:helix-turn-helix domain-containing protein [Schlegelella sp. S2-27]|uniref:Helix-turn-helix domain-containing protein n=1 Tax=Caldimonas mangrovi TaxID=2944811 RepID=A0ABT0YNG8_9BURK|nr:helix-turn-helix domain-containing protein [Caldimonas mangrovi]MCM5679964.1 helix-turn-helix domain-containing protein [Caldimonas mangrovi]